MFCLIQSISMIEFFQVSGYHSRGWATPTLGLVLIFQIELGHRLSAITGDTKSYSYLLQHLSVAVQKGLHPIPGTLFPPSSTDI